MNTPDLTFYRLIHRNMRVSSRRLSAAVAGLDESDRTQRGSKLVQWYGGFANELHEHHTVEDTVFFPALFERLPSLQGYLQRIDDEHHYLDELIASMRAELVTVTNPMVPFADAVASAAKVAADLEECIEGHLDFEDAEVLPLFERHFDAAEYKALEDGAVKDSSLKLGQMVWTVPWVMAGATPDEQRIVLESAPGALKFLWVMTRRRFARLESAALGPVTFAGASTAVAA